MELKERIKKARKMRGYKSQEKFAEFIGTTRDALSTYELGRVIPNDVFLQLMAAKLNISYEWLKEGEGDMEAQPSGIESVLDRLDGEDVDVVKIYAELPHEHKMILKEFARKVASATKPKDTAPAQEPHALTEDEWDMVQRHRTAKDGNSTEDGSLDTGA